MNGELKHKREDLLDKTKVAIAGLGGIGSHVAVLLVRAGIKQLTLIDFDKVDQSNLERQYYFIDQIGQKKVDALFNTLRKINPALSCNCYDTVIEENNIEALFKNGDIIVEALDSNTTKIMFISNCLRLFPTKKIVGVSGIAGIQGCELISTEKISENLFIVGDFISEVSPNNKLISTRVCAAASMMAHLVIQMILGLK
jgi:sulfur carrier protein ThiS adenylyltransferase